MPTLDQNVERWGKTHDWNKQGDEWSFCWGNPDMQWYGALLPRIHAFLPTATVLEIAPGYGRWTQYLKDLCQKLIVVDLNANCIDHCKNRFKDAKNIEYHVNDGSSLAMIPDNSIDFLFTFDSLVHANADILNTYLSQFSRILKKNGVAFIHHSNFAECIANNKDNPPFNKHWRSDNVSAEIFLGLCQKNGLACPSQEKITWGDVILNDTFSVVAQKNSAWDRGTVVSENYKFMQEAAALKCLSKIYGAGRYAPMQHQQTATAPMATQNIKAPKGFFAKIFAKSSTK